MKSSQNIQLVINGKTVGKVIPDDVILMEAKVNYTYLYFKNGKKVLLCQTLKSLSEKLENHGFVRIHRKTLVNMKYISHFDAINSSFVLKNGKEVEISRRKLRCLRELDWNISDDFVILALKTSTNTPNTSR
jgi:DNA-binding LytR/AlgR family response regulator